MESTKINMRDVKGINVWNPIFIMINKLKTDRAITEVFLVPVTNVTALKNSGTLIDERERIALVTSGSVIKTASRLMINPVTPKKEISRIGNGIKMITAIKKIRCWKMVVSEVMVLK